MSNTLEQHPLALPASPTHAVQDNEHESVARRSRRLRLVRVLALLCACSLSIGSHYASYILGPLKSRLSRELGTSNTEFSLLLSAFSLNSTWTPLVGGLLASHMGTTLTSIVATSLIFAGQAVLLLGDVVGSVRLMTFGMFLFGLGVSPLAVVQESIIVRFFKNHGLGLSMAFGLVVGKFSSFISARTSYPLSERFGPRAPFYMATFLAALSFAMNVVYLVASKWLVHSSGAELEASELREEASRVASISEADALKQVAEKRSVHVSDITKLGDVFWAYIAINVLCGAIWNPFTHLAPNIIEHRYDLTELDASTKSSYLLIGSSFLYPTVGFLIDRQKKGPILHILFLLSSLLTLFCYFWLTLPPSSTGTPIPGIISFGVGIGFSPLLLVIIVPTIVPSKYVPTTLGAHKSLEQTGSTLFQTFAGLLLDSPRLAHTGTTPSLPTQDIKKSIQQLLNIFLSLNIAQLAGVVGLWILDSSRKRQLAGTMTQNLGSRSGEGDEEERAVDPESPPPRRRLSFVEGHSPSLRRLSLGKQPALSESHSLQRRESCSEAMAPFSPEEESLALTAAQEEEQPLLGDPAPATVGIEDPTQGFSLGSVESGLARTKAEVLRGEVFACIGVAAIAFAWVLFIGTAILRLRSKKEREGS